MLPHLLSLFRLTVENKENYILVMRNVFINKYKIHTKYDIKGSSVDRTASTKEKEKDLEPHALKLCQDYITNYNLKTDSCENML